MRSNERSEGIEGLGLAKVDREGQALSLHRLVRRRVRVKVKPSKWKVKRRRGAKAVRDWLRATVDASRIAEVDARRGHADEALLAAEEAEHVLLWIGIADRIATHLKHRADFATSLKLYRQALEKAEALDPPNPARVAASLSNLALVLRALGEAEGARPLLERALGIAEKTFGPDHPRLATRLSNLAFVLQALGEAEGSRPLLDRALRITEKTFGPDHPTVAIRLNNLAWTLWALGERAEAKRLRLRAQAIAEKRLPANHPRRPIIRNHLGSL